MKTKAVATEVYILRLWNRQHFNKKTRNKDNYLKGTITDCKTNKGLMFNTPATFLMALEKLYRNSQRRN